MIGGGSGTSAECPGVDDVAVAGRFADATAEAAGIITYCPHALQRARLPAVSSSTRNREPQRHENSMAMGDYRRHHAPRDATSSRRTKRGRESIATGVIRIEKRLPQSTPDPFVVHSY